MFHQPLWCAGGTADAHGVDSFKPFFHNILGFLYKVTVGVDTLAFVVQYLAVAALSSAHEENEVVACGECRDVRHSVGNLSADGVETPEYGLQRYVLLDILDDTVEFVE